MLILNLLGVALTLLLMLAVFSALNARASMQRHSSSMLALAQVIATNAAPLLEKHDRHAAAALLSSLDSGANITHAVILDQRGATFASWSGKATPAVTDIGYPDLETNHPVIHTEQSGLEIDLPVFVSGTRAGTLRLRGSDRVIATANREFERIGLVFTFGAIALLVLILHRGQLRVLASTLEVSEIASRIVREHDHNLRSKLERGDELGHLTHRFNRLLRQLDSQTDAPAPQPSNPRTSDTSVFDKLINYDRITRLPGRHFFKSALNSVVQSATERRELAALMLIGLDDVSVSCAFSNAKVGNDVLRRTAKRMAIILRSSDLLCHLDGGQFAVILPTVNRLQQVQLLAERLIDAAGADEEGMRLRVSIGIACCPTDADDSFSLMRQADMAMYAARYSGTNTYRFFDKVIAHTTHGNAAGHVTAHST
ncbi:MAG: diguanylate cyclase [Rhodocyclales bacterium]|nr:diguanylate cyclase [Rhodocyclales bacterium]